MNNEEKRGCIWNVRPEDRQCRFCKLVHCEDRDSSGSRRYGKVTPMMRAMAVGDVLKLSAVHHNAAKTAAMRLGQERGVKFSMFCRGKLVYVERIR